MPYLRASVAALVPLRWESGTRFKILEAFACKTPVVSTTLGAEGLAVEHGRHLLLADDPADFASAILSLVEAPALGQRLVEPAYDLVRAEYDLSSAERQINAILARLGVLRGRLNTPSCDELEKGARPPAGPRARPGCHCRERSMRLMRRVGIVYPRANVDTVPSLIGAAEVFAEHGYDVDLFTYTQAGQPVPEFSSPRIRLRSLGVDGLADHSTAGLRSW